MAEILQTAQLVVILITAVCGAVSAIVGLHVLRKQGSLQTGQIEMHLAMNSRLDLLLSATREAAHAAGEAAGRAAAVFDRRADTAQAERLVIAKTAAATATAQLDATKSHHG